MENANAATKVPFCFCFFSGGGPRFPLRTFERGRFKFGIMGPVSFFIWEYVDARAVPNGPYFTLVVYVQ